MKIIFRKIIFLTLLLSALSHSAAGFGKYDFQDPYAELDSTQMDSVIAALTLRHFKRPTSPLFIRQLAEAYTARERTDSAQAYWKALSAIEPGNDTALYMQAEILYYNKANPDSIAQIISQAIVISPQYQYLYLLALADYRGHRDDEALVQCDKILSQFPDDANTLLLSGIVLRDGHKNKEALERFDRCLKADPANTEALLHRADQYVLLARYTDALRDYSAARADLSDNADVLNNIGICYYQSGAYAQAIAIFRKALSLDHQHPQSYFNKGLAYYHLHTLDTASADMKAAGAIWDTARADTSHASYLDAVYYLAMCYKQTGNLAAARLRFALLQKENYPKDVSSEIRDIDYALFISQNWYYFLLSFIMLVGLCVAIYRLMKGR